MEQVEHAMEPQQAHIPIAQEMTQDVSGYAETACTSCMRYNDYCHYCANRLRHDGTTIVFCNKCDKELVTSGGVCTVHGCVVTDTQVVCCWEDGRPWATHSKRSDDGTGMFLTSVKRSGCSVCSNRLCKNKLQSRFL